MTNSESSKKSRWIGNIPLVGKPIEKRLDRKAVVSVLRLDGVIGQLGGLRKQGLSLSSLAGPIEKAFSGSHVKAVALVVNSPGGSPVQSALIASRIRQWSEEKDLPVYAFCEDVAASGGYWLACAADKIYVQGASVIGSIGVVSAGFGFPALLEKIGVERRVYTAGESKMRLDPFRPEREADIEHLRDLQEDIHEQFTGYVRERRGDRLTGAPEELFSGDFWTGRQAIELGLVDEIGEIRSKMREEFGEKVVLKVISEPKGWLQQKFGFDSRMLSADAAAWSGAALSTLEARALWQRYGL